MRKLHRYENWIATAGVMGIALAFIGATGMVWIVPALLGTVGGAVRLKYGLAN